jgi:N-glycosylase/DNA lyase
MKTFEIVLKPVPPFDFDSTVYVPHYFPTPDFEWQPNFMWQTLNFGGKLLGLKMENKGTTDKPAIKLTICSRKEPSGKEIEEIVNEVNWRYGLDEDISAFFMKFENDRFLKPVFKRFRGMRNNCANSLYELLIISIVLQNASIRRTVQMMNNLFNAYGTRLTFDNRELFAYWSPVDLAKASEEELRTLKVGYRARMIKLVSEAFARGEIEESKTRKMDTEDARKELMKLYGVGPATAQNILIGYLRRYDVFDLEGKIWEQKILSRVMFKKETVPAEKITQEFERRYGKWKGLAFNYIFTEVFWRHRERRIRWLEKEIRL